MKTQNEIKELEYQWCADPCWDIEKTEGFEDVFDELLSFRLNKEREWKEKENQRILDLARFMGIGDNIELARYIDNLERRINHQMDLLEEKLDRPINYKNY